jgi:hypothetical protein
MNAKPGKWVSVGGVRINRAHLNRDQRIRLALLRLILAPLALMGMFNTGQLSRVGGGFALDIVTGRAAGPGVRTMYLALLTALPADSATIATLAETTMTGYARQAMAMSAPTAATPPSTGNTAQLTVGPVTGTMATVSHAALVSSASGTTGDFVALWALTTARTPLSGDSLQAAIAAFTLTDE